MVGVLSRRVVVYLSCTFMHLHLALHTLGLFCALFYQNAHALLMHLLKALLTFARKAFSWGAERHLRRYQEPLGRWDRLRGVQPARFGLGG